jgi:hypothetical protein
MLVSSFNLSQSFNSTPYLFLQKTVQIRDQFFLHTDPVAYQGPCPCQANPSLAGRYDNPIPTRFLRKLDRLS